MKPRLKEKYIKEIVPRLMKSGKYKNIMKIPKLQKICVNIGVGIATQNIKELDSASGDLAIITGQRPVITKARKSIASFKVREGNPIGCMVTLRGNIMYEFLDRLLSISLPRVRDFRGLSKKSFDGAGNYTMGIKEQLIFPEINYDKVESVRGMNITIATSSVDDASALELLTEFGFPFSNINSSQ
ncbi:MAG: 50S ribosomal protein L5 [Actinobacteria bacterium]|nr:50S ribosomal protein L5 [Actinomycetota bacterium]